jgi:hypothetical protein
VRERGGCIVKMEAGIGGLGDAGIEVLHALQNVVEDGGVEEAELV